MWRFVCGSLVGCTTSHHALYDGAAASLVVPRAIIRRTMMRQPRRLYHEPTCVVRWCGVYVFGAAAPLGEGDPLGLPLTPSAGWTLPEGAQVQCPRGVLALRGKRHSKRDTNTGGYLSLVGGFCCWKCEALKNTGLSTLIGAGLRRKTSGWPNPSVCLASTMARC